MHTLFTAFLFGLIAGILPGPMITAGFMTIIKNPRGAYKIIPFPLIAGSIEIIIGISMVKLGAEFFTREILLILTFLGIINILWIAFSIFNDRKNFSLAPKNFPENSLQETNNPENSEYMSISYLEIGLLTLLNGPLYFFWISICIPLALESEKNIPNGAILFVFSMVLGVAIMTWFLYFIMHISRKSFQNEKVMKSIPIVITLFFVFIGAKMIGTFFELL